MAYTPNIWVDREGTTRYFETVDNDGALIFTPDYTQVTEMGTPVNADNMNHIEEGIADHDTRIEILEANKDDSNYLKTTQITNCLLEVPQNIKLELNNGVLTLKAGSKVIIDGEHYTIPSVPTQNTGTFTTQRMVFYEKTRNMLLSGDASVVASGSTLPEGQNGYNFFFNTSDNKVYRWINGTTWSAEAGYSYPLMLVTGNGVANQLASIDQVFNGFGYIGSTVWVDKGVKGLIPNGRNEDGTLKNIEVVTSQIKTYIYPSTWTADSYLTLNSSGAFNQFRADWVNESEEAPTSNTSMFWYKPSENKLYYTTDSGSSWNQNKTIFPVRVTNTKGVLSNFQTKLPFRAVDYNEALLTGDKQEIISWGMPDYSAGVTVTANTDKTITQNGWICANYQNNGGYLYINGVTVHKCGQNASFYDSNGAIFPVSVGDVVKGTGDTLTFFPSKGAK